jgi:hypothetical protein
LYAPKEGVVRTFWPLLEVAFKDRRLNRSNLGVLSFLVSYYWTTGVAFPGIDYIGERCGISRPTVKRSLRRLEALEYIVKLLRPGHSTRYLPGKILEAGGGQQGDPTGGSTLTPVVDHLIPKRKRRRYSPQPSRQQLLDHGSKAPDGLLRGGSDAFYTDDDRLK